MTIIMKMLKTLLLTILVAILAACSTQPETIEETPPAGDEPLVESENPQEGLELTLTELKKYNGQNGKPAYIAVDGIIYDVTDVSHWKGGSHNGQNAGRDISDALNSAPHGFEVLKNLEKVGKIRTE